MTMSDERPTSFAARSAVAWIPTKVEHRVDPSATREIADELDRVGIRWERRVGPNLTRERELVLADVERYDLGGRQHPEHLDREVAQAAHADHDGGRAGNELGQ